MIDSEEDFGHAYQANVQPIYQFFYWRTQDVQLAEDLTSSVFEKAWRARHSFTTGSVRAWLYRIARNLLIDHWRTVQPLHITDEAELVSQADSTAEVIDKQIAKARLYQALSQLPSDMKTVVELRFLRGLSSQQVAKHLRLSAGNVRVIQYRALKKLRQTLDE